MPDFTVWMPLVLFSIAIARLGERWVQACEKIMFVSAVRYEYWLK